MAPAAFDEATERRPQHPCVEHGRRAAERRACSTRRSRLLSEADERAAELAIINGIQQGLAAELDMQSMYELVGDKLQEIFDAQVVDIGIYDLEAGVTHFPYAIERGVRYPDEPTPFADDDARVHRRARAGGDPRCPGVGARAGRGDPASSRASRRCRSCVCR